MLAIFKRELRSYFSTSIGYIFVGIFLALNGAVFAYSTLQKMEDSDVSMYFTLMLFAFVVILPLITMKLFSEERKLKTEQLLLTSPVSLWGMVFAKFLAAYTIFAATFLVGSLNFVILFEYGEPSAAIILGNIISILLVGAAFVAVGVFVSALTENQLIAAFGTMALLFAMLLLGIVGSYINFTPLRVLVNWLSIFTRFFPFTYGEFSFSAIVYYASIAFTFLFLTVRVFEKRRWE
ncbi:MAG: ABC transporter permease subunit [Clostridia bacterium]|nr:ABC transporter permease subunit [Clostridia bacterium]